jgi:EAL domain-containing protein (putative c-di-GMP-specific phosphodiesterase class I)
VAIFPYHGRDSDTLLINSEIALAAALRKSPPYIIYSQAYEQDDTTSWDIDSELRAAIDKDQFELYFQPQVNLKTGQPFGAEALLRWKHPDRGLVRPDYFIPIAEQSNVIHGITDWTIRAALWLTKDWPVGPVPLKVSVNMSPRVFDGGGLIESIQNSAAVFNANLNNLTLEVTESALMENVSIGTSILEELKSLGVNISIDHFGTGYSSMAYFKNISANELKIDRSFVSSMPENPKDMHIVRSMIDLSQGFGLKVVAEGVENRETFDLLKTFGCDIAQGEYVSGPMPQDKFIEWLEQYYEVC